ncbi:hypothetical protein [Streptomyces sp. NPDC001843]|uniref:hypothetical protein n=1 Tax=Streptomyces sp. NPDC001843 TaxID=3364617 RepID=UPI0036AC7DEF
MGLSTQVQDVVALLEAHDAHDVVLVGHSYAHADQILGRGRAQGDPRLFDLDEPAVLVDDSEPVGRVLDEAGPGRPLLDFGVALAWASYMSPR